MIMPVSYHNKNRECPLFIRVRTDLNGEFLIIRILFITLNWFPINIDDLNYRDIVLF